MAAKTTLGVETFSGPREHGGYRLPADIVAAISDVACGVAEGESGLKSCTLEGAEAKVGVPLSEIHNRDLTTYADEDECFNAIGDMLAAGWTHAEVAKRIRLDSGSVHLLALERYVGRIGLSCNVDTTPLTPLACASWSASRLHERRQRAKRAMGLVRDSGWRGEQSFAVLHIAYGWPDPFVNTLPKEARVALGNEFAPLARYTDATEAHRQEMVRNEVARAMRRPDGAIALTDIHARTARADRCISSGDALRDAVASFNEPGFGQRDGETKATYEARKSARKDRELAHNERRDAFITAVRVNANRMLTHACEAMRDAWASS